MNKILMVLLVLVSVGSVWAVEVPAETPAAQLPAKKVNQKDKAEMILIPAGEFLMGTSDTELDAWVSTNVNNKREWFVNETPQRKVVLDAYYIYKTEVTVEQYRKFCTATKRSMPTEPPWKWQDTHPIVNVNWDDANAYAVWAGAALPTEAQWEKAARGTDGRTYPWGNTWDAGKVQCSKTKSADADGTAPVNSFPTGASPYGVMDMAGNVWEWCADWYGEDYYKNQPAKNPTGPEKGISRVQRGGSWYRTNPENFRVNYRYYCYYLPTHRDYSLGFRCVFIP